jgi:hypothetical protein
MSLYSTFSIQHSAFNVRRSAFSVQRQRSAYSLLRPRFSMACGKRLRNRFRRLIGACVSWSPDAKNNHGRLVPGGELRVSTQPPQGRRSLATTANQDEDVVSCAKRPPGIRPGVVKRPRCRWLRLQVTCKCIHAESGGAACTVVSVQRPELEWGLGVTLFSKPNLALGECAWTALTEIDRDSSTATTAAQNYTLLCSTALDTDPFTSYICYALATDSSRNLRPKLPCNSVLSPPDLFKRPLTAYSSSSICSIPRCGQQSVYQKGAQSKPTS